MVPRATTGERVTELAVGAAELRAWSLEWSRQWWDADDHLAHNSAGSFDELPARSVHLTPQTAWVAYGLLGSTDPADHAEADAAVAALLAIQYDAPGHRFHGTFARFPEVPYPPDEPRMWEDYDPNWRQFIGTALALMLEDHPDRLSEARREAMLAAIALACEGEEAEGRLDASYANPALMHAWLDAWCGRARGNEPQVRRGEQFAARIVERFDRFGAFDEYNSPTYYGIDLYALALWRTFPPTDRFADDGERLEAAIWHEAARFHHAGLANSCGPYTRSYGPDATTTVTLLSLWIWAAFGRELAPLPDLDAASIDHGHDLMAGPLIARLAQPPADAGDRASFARFDEPRQIRRELPGGRLITAAMSEDLMVGAEASDHDWLGWPQFMPVVAHWREADGIAVLWMTDVRRVRASAEDHHLALEVERPGEEPSIELSLSVAACAVVANEIRTEGVRLHIAGEGHHEVSVSTEQIDARLHRVTITPCDATTTLRCTLTFEAVVPTDLQRPSG